ncbi:MAG: BTAD domain-containing putative transcriptional regulator [Gemmatimonadota bacterium]|nr:BTAD domain-containing putative transcriptional regulator [Gemmatimonadota bacterium]
MIEIRALGTFELLGPGEVVDPAAVLSRPKRAAVLAYLACARPYGARPRDELLAMFWPELGQENAGRALNQSVYVLRSVIGEGAISTHGNQVGLDPDLVWTDVVSFDAALDSEPRRALELYRGELLQGFYLDGSRAFERWLDTEREHYVRQAVEAAENLVDEEEAAGNPVEAIRWIRYALEIRPFEERLLRRLLRFLVERGDQANATRELERFADRLRDELGLEVSSETFRLVREGVRASDRDRLPPDSASEVGGSAATRVELRQGPTSPPRRVARTALLVAAMIAVVVGARGWLERRGAPAPDRPRVLVAALENRTGDRDFERQAGIAADWIARGLISTGLLEVVPVTSPRADGDSWIEVGAAVGAELVVAGSLQRDRSDVVLTAYVLEVESGAVLRSLEPIVMPRSSPLAAIEELRRRIAGALATVVDPRMADWADVASQPPSFESYRIYAEGLEMLEDERYLDAGHRFLEAAARDSTFTSALIWAMEAFSLTGRGPRDSLARVLTPRRDELAPWDRAMLDHHLARIRGDLRGEYDALHHLVDLSPTGQWQALLAQQALWLNRPAEALRILAHVDPATVRGIPERLYWGIGLEALHMRGQYEQELERVRRWRENGTGRSGVADNAELRALAGTGRPAAVVRWVEEWIRTRSWSPRTGYRLRRVALELRAHGHPEAAAAVLDRVFELYEAAPDSVRQGPEDRREIGRSLRTAGRSAESREVFERLLAGGHEPHIARGDLAIAAARLGDRALAEEVDRFYAELAASNPGDNGWATQWRARIAATLGDRDRAVRLIVQAHEEGWPHWTWDELVEEYDSLRNYEPFRQVMEPGG